MTPRFFACPVCGFNLPVQNGRFASHFTDPRGNHRCEGSNALFAPSGFLPPRVGHDTCDDATVPNTPGTPRRTIRIADALWDAAAAKAAERGESVSDIIRRALERYVKAK